MCQSNRRQERLVSQPSPEHIDPDRPADLSREGASRTPGYDASTDAPLTTPTDHIYNTGTRPIQADLTKVSGQTQETHGSGNTSEYQKCTTRDWWIGEQAKLLSVMGTEWNQDTFAEMDRKRKRDFSRALYDVTWEFFPSEELDIRRDMMERILPDWCYVDDPRYKKPLVELTKDEESSLSEIAKTVHDFLIEKIGSLDNIVYKATPEPKPEPPKGSFRGRGKRLKK
jgi:hypothetical protein